MVRAGRKVQLAVQKGPQSGKVRDAVTYCDNKERGGRNPPRRLSGPCDSFGCLRLQIEPPVSILMILTKELQGFRMPATRTVCGAEYELRRIKAVESQHTVFSTFIEGRPPQPSKSLRIWIWKSLTWDGSPKACTLRTSIHTMFHENDNQG